MTPFDSLKFVRFSEIVSKPSEETVIYAVHLTACTPKNLRKVSQLRIELEKQFFKPVGIVAIPASPKSPPVILR